MVHDYGGCKAVDRRGFQVLHQKLVKTRKDYHIMNGHQKVPSLGLDLGLHLTNSALGGCCPLGPDIT